MLRREQLGLTTDPTDPFFVLWNGQAVPSSHIHKIYERIFKEETVTLNPPVVRKVHYDTISWSHVIVTRVILK